MIKFGGKERLAILAAALLLAASSNAQERPDESEMFGGSGSTAPASPAPLTTSPTGSDSANRGGAENQDVRGLKQAEVPSDAFASGQVLENPLQIGGVFYQRAVLSGASDLSAADSPLFFPLEVDGYFDARPSDRIRVFVAPRLMYDPTRGNNASTSLFNASTSTPAGLSGTASGVSGTANQSATSANPSVVLDQAWIKFDIEHAIFVTAGKQHVKWGTGRFWNPTDLLSSQVRDPLLPYDLRLGNSMVRFDMPLPGRGASLSAVALLDNPQPATQLSQVGGAVRAETLVGPAEVGAEAVLRDGLSQAYGADVSSALGPFDAYAEAALFAGADQRFYSLSGSFGSLTRTGDVNSILSSSLPGGPILEGTVGLTYDFAWKENRQATAGAEYFYNGQGYDDAHIYPVLFALGLYRPFYTGKHYAALYATAEGPDAEKHTNYTVSVLGNLSDASFIARLDFSWRVLTYLTFESYADGHFGNEGGEFRYSQPAFNTNFRGVPFAVPAIAAPTFDLGLSLRVAL